MNNIIAMISCFMHTLLMTTSSDPSAAFGRVENCACCGKTVKKPVYSKRLGMWLGKDCLSDIAHFRQVLGFGGESNIANLKRDWPRSWERLMELAEVK